MTSRTAPILDMLTIRPNIYRMDSHQHAASIDSVLYESVDDIARAVSTN
jgi:hypothetical protein